MPGIELGQKWQEPRAQQANHLGAARALLCRQCLTGTGKAYVLFGPRWNEGLSPPGKLGRCFIAIMDRFDRNGE